MIEIRNIEERVKRSMDIPHGSVFACDMGGAVMVSVNCGNLTLIATATAILLKLDDEDFTELIKSWNPYVERIGKSNRRIYTEIPQKLKEENESLRAENENLRYALQHMEKEAR